MRQNSTSPDTDVAKQSWQLHSAVCLQRYPVLSAELKDVEKKVQQYFHESEVNDSFLSDYEMLEIEER